MVLQLQLCSDETRPPWVSGSRKERMVDGCCQRTAGIYRTFDNKVITFAPQRLPAVSAMVFSSPLILSKDYLKKDQKMIEDQSLAGKKKEFE